MGGSPADCKTTTLVFFWRAWAEMAVTHLMTVFMTRQRFATLICRCAHTPVQCMCQRTFIKTSYRLVTPSCQKNSHTRHAACHCTLCHCDNGVPKELMSSHRPESYSNFPCARGILEAVARSPPCTAREICHSIFPVQLRRVELKFGEESTNHHPLVCAARRELCSPTQQQQVGECIHWVAYPSAPGTSSMFPKYR